jgi:hypothetical protein
MLERGYDHASWHGTNLRGSLRGLTPRLAAWRPGAGRHNIWELIVHSAYWKYAARRRLSGDKTRSFPLEGSNFWERPARASLSRRSTKSPSLSRRSSKSEGGVDQLRADIQLLDDMHRQLLETVSAVPASRLRRRVGKSKVTRVDLIAGVAAHDLYHAGQIQLIKALSRARHAKHPRS